MNDIIIPLVTGIVCLVVGVVISFCTASVLRKKRSAPPGPKRRASSTRPSKAGKPKSREAILEAKDEIHRSGAPKPTAALEAATGPAPRAPPDPARGGAGQEKRYARGCAKRRPSRQLEAAQKERDGLARVKAEQLESWSRSPA